MKTHYLELLFEPHTIAVIGASNKPLSVGTKVFSNLLQSFTGELYPVNPKHKQIQGKHCYASIKDIIQSIDLVVIATPAATVPKIIAECGDKNIRRAVIISAGFNEVGETGSALEQQVIDIARKYKIRFIGPNCLGVMRPAFGLNATFDNNFAVAGKLAFISQSGALCATILDWAVRKQIGFSSIVSLGNSADVNFDEVLNYLAWDSQTDCILLYVEGIRQARSFLTSLRAVTCLKPVIVIKAGRNPQGSQAAVSHTAALIGADDVFTAALQQAGALRVMTIEQLFSAAEIFSGKHRAEGNRLFIVTNGGGAGVIAADHAADLAIALPKLSRHNPIDILGDATPDRYHEVMTACLHDKNCDGLLVILVPVAMSQPLKVAEQIVELNKQTNKPILACWMGQKQVEPSWELFAKNNIPHFNTPEAAVDAFSYLANYQSSQQFLQKASEPAVYQSQSDIAGARSIIDAAISEHRFVLTAMESKAILKAFGISVTQAVSVQSANEAVTVARSLGFPIAMKINSPDITHKQDVGGVQLNITNADATSEFFQQMLDGVKKKCPQAKILGVTIERMYKTPYDRELMIGILRDPVFGPVVSFGAGGSLAEIMQDRAIALPPLNHCLIKNLIAKTRAAKLLEEFRNKPAVKLAAIENILLRVSEMACELPQIKEMDINPLIVNNKEAIAVDARIVIEHHLQ